MTTNHLNTEYMYLYFDCYCIVNLIFILYRVMEGLIHYEIVFFTFNLIIQTKKWKLQI